MPDSLANPQPELRILKSEAEVVEAIAQIIARLAVRKLQAAEQGKPAAKGAA